MKTVAWIEMGGLRDYWARFQNREDRNRAVADANNRANGTPRGSKRYLVDLTDKQRDWLLELVDDEVIALDKSLLGMIGEEREITIRNLDIGEAVLRELNDLLKVSDA